MRSQLLNEVLILPEETGDVSITWGWGAASGSSPLASWSAVLCLTAEHSKGNPHEEHRQTTAK